MYIYTYICIYVHICFCIYICISICIYTYVYNCGGAYGILVLFKVISSHDLCGMLCSYVTWPIHTHPSFSIPRSIKHTSYLTSRTKKISKRNHYVFSMAGWRLEGSGTVLEKYNPDNNTKNTNDVRCNKQFKNHPIQRRRITYYLYATKNRVEKSVRSRGWMGLALAILMLTIYR